MFVLTRIGLKLPKTSFSLLHCFCSDLVEHFGVSMNLKKLTTIVKKKTALKNVCDKLQYGNHPEITEEKEYAKSSESWLPSLLRGDQLVKIMLFLEDWMGSFYNSKEVSAKRMEIVKAALNRRQGLYTDDEKSCLLIVFITVADWE